MGPTTFGIDQITFLMWLCGTFVFVILGLCGYGIILYDRAHELRLDNIRLSKEVYKLLGHESELREYIKTKVPGGAPGYIRNRLKVDDTIYADYKEITVPLSEPSQGSFPDYDKAIRDATARLTATGKEAYEQGLKEAREGALPIA